MNPNKIDKIRLRPDAFRATWTVDYDDLLWKYLRTIGSDHSVQKTNGKATGYEFLAIGTAISGRPRDIVFFLACSKYKEEKLAFTLSRRPMPNTPPPAKVRAIDRRLKGKVGLQKLLSDKLLKPNTLLIADFSIELNLKTSDGWHSPVIPRAPGDADAPLVNIGKTTHVEQIGYRFEEGANGLRELTVVYFHKPSSYHIHIDAHGALILASEMEIPCVQEISDFVAQ